MLERANFLESGHKMRLLWPSKQLRLIHCVLILVAVFLVYLGIFFVVDSLDWQAEAAEIQRNKVSSGTDEADFSQSVMLGPDHKIREGDTIDYEIILRNTGSKRPDYIELWNKVDSGAMLASAPELSYNLENRELHWRGTVDPGEERRFTLRLVTIPKSAGTWVSNHASIVWDGKRKDIQFDIEVRSKQRNAKILFTVAGIGLGWLEVMILGYLVFAPLFLIAIPWLIRWRERQRFERSPDVSWHDDNFRRIMVYAMSIFFVVCLAVMLFFASIVFEDIRKFTSYEKTTCTILDKKIRWSTGSTGRTKSKIFEPLVSVRYDIRGKEIVSAGSLAKGAVLSSRERSAEKRLARYELCRSYPCWFDPEDPQEFVLTRGLSWGWYLLCLGPLILFLISSRYLLRKLRGPNPPSEMSNAPIQ
jgi:hypothetical protein